MLAPPLYLFLLLIPVFLGSIILTFYIAKILIERVIYKEQALVFEGDLGEYLKVFFFGMILTIITVAIYAPWWIRNMLQYFSSNTKRQGETCSCSQPEIPGLRWACDRICPPSDQ